MAMAGLYEIWRDPTRDEDDPQRFAWTCTVLTTSAEDAVGHIHDRMPLLVEPERYAAWLDPTSSRPRRTCAACWCRRPPAGSRPTRSRTAGQQRPQQRPRARRPAARRAGAGTRDDQVTDRRHPARRRTPAPRPLPAPDRHPAARPRRRAAASDARDLAALAAELPRAGRLGGAGRAALAGGRQEGRAPPAGARRVLRGGRRRAAGAHPARGRRPQRRGPLGRPDRPRARRLRRASRWPSRCTRRVAPSAPGCPSWTPSTVPTLVVQGERDPFGRPEEFPPDVELTVVPGADHGFAVPKRGPVSPEEVGAIMVEAAWSGSCATSPGRSGIPAPPDVLPPQSAGTARLGRESLCREDSPAPPATSEHGRTHETWCARGRSQRAPGRPTPPCR